jgi:hypothetical protein
MPGEHKVTLAVSEIEPKKGELVESNNEISTFVTVLKGGLRVQYLDGGVGSFEPTFVCRALDKSPQIKVDFSYVRGPLADGEPGSALFDHSRYDVFMLRDLPRSWIPDAALKRLADAVESGAGLVMLGGRQSFGPGGYAGTPVAELLPVSIHPGDRQIDGSLALLPTPQGVQHFVMRLGSEPETQRNWQSLRPLEGASSFSGVKERARVLAESSNQLPLIVAQDFGQGRTMAIAVDTTWLWWENEASLRHHRRFWRQVILWLAKKEQAGEDRVWVDLGKRRIAAGESLEVAAGAEDDQGNPILDASFEATITSPEGNPVPLKLLPQGDRVRGTFWGSNQAGDYQIAVTARREGEEIGSTRVLKFLVYEDDTELTAPAADLSLLAQMAQLTGGQYVQPERLPGFLEELRRQDLHLNVERLTQYRLWDNWPFFLAFVSLLTAEWAMRKWRGWV